MAKFRAALSAASLALCCTQALAFGDEGHQAVGTVADALLRDARAGMVTRKVLGSNLRTAAIWADCARSVKGKPLAYVRDPKYKTCAVYENPASEKALVSYVARNTGHKRFHFANIPYQRSEYTETEIGAAPDDIVAAIRASTAYLSTGQQTPSFNFNGKREALRLLVHLVGDLHQPLHVASVYLDPDGRVVNPEAGTFDVETGTTGGNDIFLAERSLHSVWDGIADVRIKTDPLAPEMLMRARAVPASLGSVDRWPVLWATETLIKGKDAFEALEFSAAPHKGQYQVRVPAMYQESRITMQREQVTLAGARLAQILRTIWP